MSERHGAPFVLYGRAWCHLCEEMRAELEPIAARFGVAIEWIDIDEDPQLEARYNERVPVLMLDGVELCHYRLDGDAVLTVLQKRSR
ncbi:MULTISPECIES: glutaredoxin family protein [unclassified Caballeronia]|uniref:glutaredoxin family protein n=1 Tax=unclassified Caballeronia TaxID=2646786 RepID=UPI002859AF33|nr:MULTISPECIES: glutaredoxin family protein [unclassified Caballeronia]MDR5737873.1 glutaredoxin family protein [Caballeronia sp. LZ016]MDR5809591.1 glutaredoxin family protein [Caballeronia sp. LZ019]